MAAKFPGRPGVQGSRWSGLRFLTVRGWSLLVCGAGAVVLAWLLGRRELLNVAVFLVAAPLAAAVALRVGVHHPQVGRSFIPHRATAHRDATVAVEIAPPTSGTGKAPAAGGPPGSGLGPGPARPPSGGPLRMAETLPPGFGPPPSITVSEGTFRYRLRPPRRGLYAIGPLTLESTDPFGLARRTVAVGAPSPLTVLGPLPRLDAGRLPGLHGGAEATAARGAASADSDDAGTREYRDGDPLRRVHWGATARQGRLMVRQEQPRTPRRATLLVDRSAAAFAPGTSAPDRVVPVGNFTGTPGTTTACFDWALAAAAGIGAHLAALGYAVEMLDGHGEPLAASSPTASDPARAVFEGPGSVEELRCVLAAVGLEPAGGGGPPISRPERSETARSETARPAPGTHGVGRGNAGRYGSGGPVVLLSGRFEGAAALAWVDAIGPDRAVNVLLADGAPEGSAEAVRIFRENGWRAVAVAPHVPLEQAWLSLDTWAPPPPSRDGGPAGQARQAGPGPGP